MKQDIRLIAAICRSLGILHPREWVAFYESHTPDESKVTKATMREPLP